jgi:meiotic recombination protein REC8
MNLMLGDTGPVSVSHHPQLDDTSEVPHSTSAAAPQRRRHKVSKVIAFDQTIELRNRDLLYMNNSYLDRMTEERQKILSKKAAKQVKDGSLRWILGGGINGVGNGIGMSHGMTPLSELFSGIALFEFVTGRTLETRGQKRESEGSDTVDARHIRPRLHKESQVGRDTEIGLGYDTQRMSLDDMEVGRNTPNALGDISSSMPWNFAASIRGSSVHHGLPGSGPGVPGSVAGSIGRHGSRMISASPLHGRPRLSGLEPFVAIEGLESDFILGGELAAFVGPSDDAEYEMYARGAEVDNQTASKTSWQKTILDQESNNFLEFIKNAIAEKRVRGDQAHIEVDSVEFEEMFSPNGNSRVLAARALLNVLILATKHLIVASQFEEYGSIHIHLQPVM